MDPRSLGVLSDSHAYSIIRVCYIGIHDYDITNYDDYEMFTASDVGELTLFGPSDFTIVDTSAASIKLKDTYVKVRKLNLDIIRA